MPIRAKRGVEEHTHHAPFFLAVLHAVVLALPSPPVAALAIALCAQKKGISENREYLAWEVEGWDECDEWTEWTEWTEWIE